MISHSWDTVASAPELIAALEGVPRYCTRELIDYVETGKRPRNFLVAVLNNDLYAAAIIADDANQIALFAYGPVLRNLPPECWGSDERIICWLAHRGLAGMVRATSTASGMEAQDVGPDAQEKRIDRH